MTQQNTYQDQLDNALVCTNCGAEKVARSRFKNVDRVIMCFWPSRPYRCLHCYHRFWNPEPFFKNKARVMSWLGLIALLISFGLLLTWNQVKVMKPKPFSDFGSSPNAVLGQPLIDVIEPSGAVQPSFADNLDPNLELTPSSAGVASADVTSKTDLSIKPSLSRDVLEADKTAAQLAAVNDAADPAVVLEQFYTTEQLQQRLELAKASAEQAEKVNLQNQARLQQSVAAEQDEVQSLLKVDINFRIDQWRKAWEVGFVDDYLSFYSDDFTPANELSRAQWVAQRKQRIRPSKKIDLIMDNFDVVFADNNTLSTVSFDQVYKSGLHVESSRKELVLRRQQQEWKILSETDVSDQAAP